MVEALDVLSSSTDFCFSFWKAISKSLLSNHRLKLFQVGFQELQGLVSFFFLRFIYLFLDRGEGKERGRKTSMCGCLLHTPNWGLRLQPRHVP